jgi:hypothetical protein
MGVAVEAAGGIGFRVVVGLKVGVVAVKVGARKPCSVAHGGRNESR